jgi:hypothetical protein
MGMGVRSLSAAAVTPLFSAEIPDSLYARQKMCLHRKPLRSWRSGLSACITPVVAAAYLPYKTV